MMPGFLQDRNLVTQRFAGQFPFEQATAYLCFQKGNRAQRLVHSFKYHNNPRLAFWLGQQAARALQEARHPICQVEQLIPTPLHPTRLWERGYNQAEWIARGLQSVWGTPVNTHVLQRKKATRTQTRNNQAERWENMRQAFYLQQPEQLKGRHVLLIDDVITTGSTLTSCANTLLAIEGVRISLFATAIVSF